MKKTLILLTGIMAFYSGSSNAEQITFEQLLEIRDLACSEHKSPDVCKMGINIIMYNTDKIAQFYGVCEQMKKHKETKSLYEENTVECQKAAEFVKKAKSLLSQ